MKRNSIGRREFTDNDLHLMRTIVCLKNAGVSVADIATFIALRLEGDTTLNDRYQLLKTHEQELQQRITDLQDTMSYLKLRSGIMRPLRLPDMRIFILYRVLMKFFPVLTRNMMRI